MFDIDGFIQRQDAITLLTRSTDGFRIRIACVPVKDLFVILPGIWMGVCSQLENVLTLFTVELVAGLNVLPPSAVKSTSWD